MEVPTSNNIHSHILLFSVGRNAAHHYTESVCSRLSVLTEDVDTVTMEGLGNMFIKLTLFTNGLHFQFGIFWYIK